jgi:hypothetical protein
MERWHFRLVGWPLAIFLLWRLLLWIGQLAPDFWTVRTMAFLGAVLFAAYGVFGQPEWAIGGNYASRAVGGLIAYAATGGLVGAVMSRFLPKTP